jgi:hypothetical protein
VSSCGRPTIRLMLDPVIERSRLLFIDYAR